MHFCHLFSQTAVAGSKRAGSLRFSSTRDLFDMALEVGYRYRDHQLIGLPVGLRYRCGIVKSYAPCIRSLMQGTKLFLSVGGAPPGAHMSLGHDLTTRT